MTGIAVVPLNTNCSTFADNMSVCRQYFGKCVPVVRVKNAVLQMLYFVVQSSEGFSITITEYPGNSSPCATVNRFDEPQFSFFCRYNAISHQILFLQSHLQFLAPQISSLTLLFTCKLMNDFG